MHTIIYDDWEEMLKYLPDKSVGYSTGITVDYGNGIGMVGISSKHQASIPHEAIHIANSIWNYIGYNPQRDNDEVTAYLVTYIYKKINEVFDKHKGSK